MKSLKYSILFCLIAISAEAKLQYVFVTDTVDQFGNQWTVKVVDLGPGSIAFVVANGHDARAVGHIAAARDLPPEGLHVGALEVPQRLGP